MEILAVALLSFLVMLVLLVVVHELGHYWSAKAYGVKVVEFGIGFPPRAFGLRLGRTEVLVDEHTVFVRGEAADLEQGRVVSLLSSEDGDGRLVARFVDILPRGGGLASLPWRRSSRGEAGSRLSQMGRDDLMWHEGRLRAASESRLTVADEIFSVNWLPLGGFVRLWGEDQPNAPRSLARLSPARRAVVLLSGSAVNAVFPFVAMTVMFMVPYHEVVVGKVEIGEVVAGSPAEAAGVEVGDRVLALNGRAVERPGDVARGIRASVGEEMTWLLEREGERRSVMLTPRVDPPRGEGAAGIRYVVIDPVVERRSHRPWEAVYLGTAGTVDMVVVMGREVWKWVGGAGSPELSGPVGIARVTGEVTRDVGVRGWLLVAAVLSINLAVLNALPVPMLDGGRLVFVLIEWARGGKRISPRKEGMVHLVGFVAMVALVVAVSVTDVVRLLRDVGALGG